MTNTDDPTPNTGVTIRHDRGRQRFTARLDAGEAYLQYEAREDGRLDYVSTFVPPQHRNQGIGAAIVRHALDYARAHGRRIIPTCPFVTRVLEEDPQYQDLMSD